MLENNSEFSIRKQCSLLSVPRSSAYYKPLLNDESELMNLMMEIYLESDCRYGYRKLTQALEKKETRVNHKKVLRLMKAMQIQGLYPRRYKNTSQKDGEHKIYPYLLAGLEIRRPNHVWATDLTYICIKGVFMYFVAIIDVYSRYIIASDLSHSLEAIFCIDTLKQALNKAVPEIFNSDQGAQFTSNDFIEGV